MITAARQPLLIANVKPVAFGPAIPTAATDILVGGEFTTLGATSRVRVARINGDGSVDTGFNASLSSAAVARVSALAASSAIPPKDSLVTAVTVPLGAV